MNLELQTIWSPDVNPPSSGLPGDIFNFDIFVQMSVGEVGISGGEVFECRVCSATALATAESGQFISHTLVLDRFEWSAVESRINNLLRHAGSCKDWNCVIKSLYPCVKYSDQW